MRAHMVSGLVFVAAACGGAGDAPSDARVIDAAIIDAPVDAPVDAAGLVCHPFAPAGEQGCALGEKCTWIWLQLTPTRLGTLGCVPDGIAQVDEPCTLGPPGETSGYDNCAAGLYCLSGTCAAICGFDGGANAACPEEWSCARYATIFANGTDDPVAGVCEPRCDPLTQLRPDGADCGLGRGCYVTVSATDSIALCTFAGAVGHGEEILGRVFVNSCVPGAQPRRREPSSLIVECGGLCRVTDVTSTLNMTSEGGVSPDSCSLRWGAAPPYDTLQGESCRYWWAREPFENLSPFSNALGWCFKHSVFRYDSDRDSVPDAPFPRCVDLTTGDLVPPFSNPPHNDAQYFWCVTAPVVVQTSVSRIERLRAREPWTELLRPW